MPLLVKTDLIKPWFDGEIEIGELSQLSFEDLQYETA